MIVCVAAAAILGCTAEEPAWSEKWAVPMACAGVPNLHKVSDRLYRSAQPTAEGMTNLVALGVKTVVGIGTMRPATPRGSRGAPIGVFSSLK